MSLSSANIWGVAVLSFRGAGEATKNLLNQGIDSYRPMYRETSVRRGRRVNSSVPLFGSYLFVGIRDGWRAITGTRGVSHVILTGELPSRVQPGFVEKLKSSEDQTGHVSLPKPPRRQHQHSTGDKVRIYEGQFHGFTGIYEGMSARDRDVVLLSILGAERRVELNYGDLG
jgi:transcription antitermination factor NusG